MSAARLLICDDVDDIRLLMRIAFEGDDDFEVVGEAANGEEGIRAARQLKPDAILLDLNMPVLGGLEALPQMRRAVPDAAIVIFSGFEEWSRGSQARRCGADAYIEKGTDVGEVLQLVKTVIEGRRSGGSSGASSVG